MCLIPQETCCSSQVLKPWRLDQETSEERLFIIAGQVPNSSRQITIYRSLMSLNSSWQIISIEVSTVVSIKNYENQYFRSDFRPMFMYLCRVSFLTTLEIYNAYLKGRHIREYKENTCKRWPMPYSLWKKLLHFCALGFCNQVLLDLHCWWSEKLCSQQSSSSWWVSHVLGAVHHWLVTYWDPRKNGGVHILKSSEVLKR